LLSGVNRTGPAAVPKTAYDPERTNWSPRLTAHAGSAFSHKASSALSSKVLHLKCSMERDRFSRVPSFDSEFLGAFPEEMHPVGVEAEGPLEIGKGVAGHGLLQRCELASRLVHAIG
jgi:hypothetical protein